MVQTTSHHDDIPLLLNAALIESSADSRVARRDLRASRWSRPCRAAPSSRRTIGTCEGRRSRLERPPRSRRRSRLEPRPDPVGSWASALLRALLRYSAAVSNHPDRGGDRVSAVQIAAEIALRRCSTGPRALLVALHRCVFSRADPV
ncbi:hypothetical protein VNO78_30600 [Psophocarpus tetragonolobus]|uniref:Uncharacterized protein n=1 Tax=Psophocarpus tetragonolobus TaxID=3891 RepID=A0AAN9X5L5_PSOTE